MKLPFDIWLIWMAVGAILITAEILVPGFFILWFGVGAVVAGVLALLGFSTVVQLGAFVVVSGVLLFFSRKIANRITRKQPPGVGANRLVGMTGPVTVQIDPIENSGQVRLGGEYWRAEGDLKEKIAVGTVVEVVYVDGTRVIVKRITEEQ